MLPPLAIYMYMSMGVVSHRLFIISIKSETCKKNYVGGGGGRGAGVNVMRVSSWII